MSTMNHVNIIVPVENHDEAESYYRNVLSFEENDGLFFLPIKNSSVALFIMSISAESKPYFPEKKRFPTFLFELERNFLSYCMKIYERGALFDMACRRPEGYYARILDPAGNQFEIWCYSDEEDNPVNKEKMPFFLDACD